MVKEGKKITGPEQLKDAAFGCARIRGDTLGIVGLGQFTPNQTVNTEETVSVPFKPFPEQIGRKYPRFYLKLNFSICGFLVN